MLISKKFASGFQSSENCVKISQSFMIMALGDIKFASYLSQIFYWHIPSKDNNKYKLRVKIDDEFWLAKADKDWFNECFISFDEARNAKKMAIKLGLIKTITRKYKGNPTTHTTLTDKFENVLEKCSDYLLDYEFPDSKKDLIKIAKSLNIYKKQLCVKSKVRSVQKTHNELSKKHKTLTDTTITDTTKKRIINNSNDPKGPINKKSKTLIKSRKLTKIVKKKKTVDSKENVDIPKPKYKHSITDLRNYNELLSYGITKHKSPKAKNNSLDKLHALFSSQCKAPYKIIDIPKKYDDFEWDLDTLIEVFEYHMKQADKYGKKKIRSIGSFIFQEGFNGGKSWSPLLFWHQKMNRSAEGELTQEGKRFLSSLKRADVHGIDDIDSSILNRVAKATEQVSQKYVFVEGGERTMSYPFGIIDVVSKYIKEKMDKNYKFKLVYITKNGFIADEFLPMAKDRNILKLKNNNRSVLV